MPVLAAIDIDRGAERPISVGYDLATAFDDTLIVMYVMPQSEYDERRASRDELPEEFEQQELTIERAREFVTNRVADTVDETLGSYDPARVELRGRVGTPAEEVLAIAEEINPRFLVVGGRKRSPAKQAIFGSVSQAIVRGAEQPVVTTMEATAGDGPIRDLVSRTIEGVETLVTTESDEIFIDVPATDPRYIRVEAGDTIREGDIRTQREEELESSSLRKWSIETIGSETVIGTDQETGERSEWDRESFERRLATGGLSTTLTDFDRLDVTGAPSTADRETGRSEEATVTVAVYGNDGRKFTRTYRLVDDGETERRLELTDDDAATEKFEPALRKRFDRAVERALRNEGYTV